MKLKIITILIFALSITTAKSGNLIQSFSKTSFYAILKSGKIDDVNNELDLLRSSSINEKDGYEAALVMRKAGLEKIPVQKLKYFKKGRIQLETAISNNNANGEYHFLRLMIQEHAPKVAKYSTDLETDKACVKKSFQNLSPSVQQVIIDYSKNSKIIHPEDFK